MKLHLPVRLFRAVVALSALGGSLLHAAYTEPTEITLPSGYTATSTSYTFSDFSKYNNTSDSVVFLLSSDCNIDSQTSTLNTNSWWYFTSQSVSRLSDFRVTNSTQVIKAKKGLYFNYLDRVQFSKNSVSTGKHSSLDSASAGASQYGGALYGDGCTITLTGNRDINFSGNSARVSTSAENPWSADKYSKSASASSFAYGAAIYSKDVVLSYNGGVYFENNYISTSSSASSFSALQNASASATAWSYGSAIYASSSVSITGNDIVSFSGNSARASASASARISGNSSGTATEYASSSAYGAAIYSPSISIKNNGSVTFQGNTLSANETYGGAIYSSTSVTLQQNGDILFSGNSALQGGAIYASTVSLTNNNDITFTQNSGYAIYAKTRVNISGNGNVTFQNNTGGAIYIASGTNTALTLSASKGKHITFYNAVSMSSGSGATVAFNQNGTGGDIIFTGSSTSDINNHISVYGGSLQVVDGAKLNGRGISITPSTNTSATLLLRNAELNHKGYYFSIDEGAVLTLSGVNRVTAQELELDEASTLHISLSSEHTNSAALTLTGSLNVTGVQLELDSEQRLGPGKYKLLEVSSFVSNQFWNKQYVTLLSSKDYILTFDALSWEDNVLYLNLEEGMIVPELLTATWTNSSGDGIWNNDNSVNWKQGDFSYAYEDGVEVVFGNIEAGSVILEGNLAPKSVLVNSLYDYTFEGDGSMVGDMSLTKKGKGTLTIKNANSYVGGTSIEAGTVVLEQANALGSGEVILSNGSNLYIATDGFNNPIIVVDSGTIEVDDNFTHYIESVIQNDGKLTLEGNFEVSKLGELVVKHETGTVNTDGNRDESGGFSANAIMGIQFATGEISGENAVVSHAGENLILGKDGWATRPEIIDYSLYTIRESHSINLKAVNEIAIRNGVSQTDINLCGGVLTVDDLFSGKLTITGSSSIIAENWTVSSVLKNEGDLSLSGTIYAENMTVVSTSATYVDTENNSGAHGFSKDAGKHFQFVSGGTVSYSDASIINQGLTYTLDNDGVAYYGGKVHYDNYLIGSNHQAKLSDIVRIAEENGVYTVDVQVAGGCLEANHTLQGCIEATGNSSLVADNWSISSPIRNGGTLSISGNIYADALPIEEYGSATYVDTNGITGNTGFSQDAGQKISIIQGGVTVNDGANVIRNGLAYELGADGTATRPGTIHYEKYKVAKDCFATLSDIVKVANNHDVNNIDISLDGGTLIADRELTGKLVCSDNSLLLASNWNVSDFIYNSGVLTVSGRINADNMVAETSSATRISATGESGTSGFYKDGDSWFTLVVGGTVDGKNAQISRNGLSYTLQSDGVAYAEGAIDYSSYLISSGHNTSLSNIVSAAGAGRKTDIELNGGTLTIDTQLTGELINRGTSRLITNDWLIASPFTNNGTIILSGTILANSLSAQTTDPSYVNINGESSSGGFLRDSGKMIILAQGGTIVDYGVSIWRDGELYTLQSDGTASTGGTIHYDSYYIGNNHSVKLTDIVSAASQKGVYQTNVHLDGGVLTIDRALTGTLTCSGTSYLNAESWEISSSITNSGSLTLSGTIKANKLTVQETPETHVDINGTTGASGYLKEAVSKLTVVQGGDVISNGVTIQHNGDLYILKSNGDAIRGGEINYSEYLIASDHRVKLSDIHRVSYANSEFSPIVYLYGGTLEAAMDSSVAGGVEVVTSGCIVANNWQLDKTITNRGTLTLTGTLDVSNIGELTDHGVTYTMGGQNGFKNSNSYSIKVVDNYGTISSTASIKYNDISLTLRDDGIAYAAGKTDWSVYYITSGHSVYANQVVAAASGKLNRIEMAGGKLFVNSDVLVKANNGDIMLTSGNLTGRFNNVNMTVSGGNIGGIFGSVSTLTGNNYKLNDSLLNEGSLTLKGTFDASALSQSGSISSTKVDLNGKKGASGYVQSEGFTLQVVSGGTVNDDSATILYNGKVVTLSNSGLATVEGGILYNRYYIASGHTANVSDIARKSTDMGSSLVGISLSAGGTLNANATTTVTATGGTINLSSGSLSGTLQAVTMTATSGNILGTFSGNSSLKGNNYAILSTLKNNGVLTLTGSFKADWLKKTLTGVDVRVDVNGTEGGTSGFLRTGDYTITLAEGTVKSSNAKVTYNGTVLSLNGGIGYGKGTVDYSRYLLTTGNEGEVSDIKTAANYELKDIIMIGGELTVDDSMTVNATGGHIVVTDNSTLNGSIQNTDITTDYGSYNSTINATLTGNMSLDINGGNITVTGSNTYTGGTIIYDGFLEVGSKTALGTNDVYLQGGTLHLNSTPVTNDIFATGGTLAGCDNYRGKLTTNGNVTLDGPTSATGGIEINGGSIFGDYIEDTGITVNSYGNIEIGSDIRGNSSLTVNNGNVTVSGSNNDYTGGTTINNGNLIIGRGSSLGSGDIVINGGSLDTNGQVISNSIYNNGGTIITSYVLGQGHTLTVGSEGMNMTGNLTLTGGTIHFEGQSLVVEGKVESLAPVNVYVCGYSVIDENGTVKLADFGNNTVGLNAASFHNIGYGDLVYSKYQNTLSITLTEKNIWLGGKGTTWSQNSGAGWAYGKTFTVGNRTVFNTGGTVTITGAVEPASTLVDVSKSLTFKTSYNKKTGLYSGSIVGYGCIVKRGVGKLTMNDGNTYTGGTFIEAGTVNAKGAASFGTGAITLNGGTLNLASKAVANDITLNGAAAIKSGKKFLGSYTQTGGELMKGSVLNVAESATISGGVVNGTLSGYGMVFVTGDAAVGKTGKVTTSGLDISGSLAVSSKGLSMNTKTSAITVNSGGELISEGALKAAALTVDGGVVGLNSTKASSIAITNSTHLTNGADVTAFANMKSANLTMTDSQLTLGSAQAQLQPSPRAFRPSVGGSSSAASTKPLSLTVKGNLNITSSALTLSGKISAGNLSVTDSYVNMTSGKLQTIAVKNTLTLSGDNSFVFNFDAVSGKSYKLFTFKSFNSGGADLYDLLGWENNGSYTLTANAKDITLTVLNDVAWESYMDELLNSGAVATLSEDDELVESAGAQVLVAPADVDPRLGKVADTLVQSTWGTAGASRAFGDTIASRGTHATALANGKGAAWISTMGGSSRLSADGGHAGADYTLTGAAFGMEARLSEQSTIGLAIGNSWGKVSTFSAYPVDADSTHQGIYGKHVLGSSTTLSWMAAHTRTESDANLAGMACDWTQDALQLDARVDKLFAISERTTVSAFVGMQYLATDKGECNGLSTGSLQNLRGEIGVSAAHKATDRAYVYGELSFIGDMVRHNPTATVGDYRSRGANPGRAGLNLSVGGTYQLNDSWSLNASYNLELMQNQTSHSANVGTTYSF